MKPIVIYSNNTFNKLSFENKYKEMVDIDIKRFNKTLNDVNKNRKHIRKGVNIYGLK